MNTGPIVFGVAGIGTAIYSTAPGLLLLYFLTDIAGAPPALAGLVLLGPRVLDAVLDPFIGALVGRMRLVRRVQAMSFAAIVVSVAFSLQYMAPLDAGTSIVSLWIAATFLIANLAFAAFLIPYLILPSQLGLDRETTRRAFQARVAFQGVGTIIAGVGGPLIVSGFGDGAVGYVWMGLVLSILTFAAFAVTAYWAGRQQEPTVVPTAEKGGHWREQLVQRYGLFLLSCLAYAIAVFGSLAMMPYLATSVLNKGSDAVAALFLAFLGGSAIGLPLWGSIARRASTTAALAASLLLFSASLFVLCILGAPNWWSIGSVVFLCGLAHGGAQMGLYGLLNEIVAGDSIRRDGLVSGLLVSSEKFGVAVGPALAAFIIAQAGYQAGGAATPEVQSGIMFAFAGAPAAAAFVAFMALAARGLHSTRLNARKS